jgi:hypothetical protein
MNDRIPRSRETSTPPETAIFLRLLACRFNHVSRGEDIELAHTGVPRRTKSYWSTRFVVREDRHFAAA